MKPLITKKDLENVRTVVEYIVSRKLAKYRTESLLLWKIRSIEALSDKGLSEELKRQWIKGNHRPLRFILINTQS